MPAIRRLLFLPLLLLTATPLLAQGLVATTDVLPVQAPPGTPPAVSTPPANSGLPQQSRPPEGTTPPAATFPSRGGYQCERSRPTS